MSKSVGSWIGGCARIQETEAQCLASALSLFDLKRGSFHLFGRICCPLSSTQLACPFRPQIPWDREGPFLYVSSVSSTKGPSVWSLRYCSHINNYSGGKSHPGPLLSSKLLLF